MADYRTVTDGEGRYLGRLTAAAPIAWVDAAHASCLTVDAAAALCVVHGGAVVRVPVWNPMTKTYDT